MATSLRPLAARDLPFMLEWMHDPEVNRHYAVDFAAVTAEQARQFIDASQDDRANRHFAFVNAADEYLGTISLKHITATDAEYAVATRRSAQGTGAAATATTLLLRCAFDELQLAGVYLVLKRTNVHAQRFYDKCGFVRAAELTADGLFRYTMSAEQFRAKHDDLGRS